MATHPEPIRIFLAEQDEDTRFALSQILSEFECDVTVADRVPPEPAALSSYALALVNVLPGDAAAMTQYVAAATALGVTVGLTHTTRLSPELISHASFVLPKPFDVETLLTSIARHWRRNGDTRDRLAREENVRRYFASLSQRDWDGVVAHCTDRVIYTPPAGSPFPLRVEGREAFRRHTEETFRQFPEATFEVQSIWGLPNAAITEFRGRWTREPTRTVAELGGTAVFRFDEHNRIQEVGVALDARRLRALMVAS